jgi:hypothetical protein
MADSATPAFTIAPLLTESRRSVLGLHMPDQPFPGQRTPPCTRNGEVEINDGCWYLLGAATLPCREDAYDWKKGCYLPSYPLRRESTSYPP